MNMVICSIFWPFTEIIFSDMPKCVRPALTDIDCVGPTSTRNLLELFWHYSDSRNPWIDIDSTLSFGSMPNRYRSECLPYRGRYTEFWGFNRDNVGPASDGSSSYFEVSYWHNCRHQSHMICGPADRLRQRPRRVVSSTGRGHTHLGLSHARHQGMRNGRRAPRQTNPDEEVSLPKMPTITIQI